MKEIQAGRKHILDYVVKPMLTKEVMTQVVMRHRSNWVGEIAQRCARNFDPTSSTVLATCNEVAQAVYSETMRRVSEQQRSASVGISPTVKMQWLERWMELSAKNISALKSEAATLGIRNYKNMKKDALIKEIFIADKQLNK